MKRLLPISALILSCLAIASLQSHARTSVVNMIPATLSGETGTDSEPNLAVNPSNRNRMAASAFTPDPLGSANAPIYVSTDRGRNWVLNAIVPGGNAAFGTGDITLRFGSSGVLYAGILRGDSYLRLNILRAADFTTATTMTVLVDRTGNGVDQPYVQALSATVAGATVDRLYVGQNDFNAPNNRTATVEDSLDAATAAAPAGLATQRVEARNTCAQDGPSVRPAVHRSGTVYSAFFGWTVCGAAPFTANVVVVRDDNWGTGANAFTALQEPGAPTGDGTSGVRVARGVSIPWGSRIGNQRVGSQLSLAVDPNDSQRVYIAWGDGTSGATFTLRVRRSTDGGSTWSGDLRTVVSATNPSLAISSTGKVAFLYQRLEGTAPNTNWVTHLERSVDDFATAAEDMILHQAPSSVGGAGGAGPLGDYTHLLSLGRDFYGVFSGNNTPDTNNFPQGVTYLRNANFTTHTLLANDNVTPVAASIDPFFFSVEELIHIDPCLTHRLTCTDVKMGKGVILLKCLEKPCIKIDPVPRNCLYKYDCGGCPPGGLCPPYYHFFFDGLDDVWDVGLFTAKGEPVAHEQITTKAGGIVVSFRPDRSHFLDGQIGDYIFAFEMGPKGKAGVEYRVKTRLQRSDRPYVPAKGDIR